MPYKIKKVKGGYKVCKKNNDDKCFSNDSLTKKKAKDQMQAIIANESFEEYIKNSIDKQWENL